MTNPLARRQRQTSATTLTFTGIALGLPLAYLLYAPYGITGVAAGRILSVAIVAVGGWIALRRRGFDGAPWA